MARTSLTTAWSTIGTTVTAANIQNIGPDVVLVAVAASAPAAGAEVGYVLQAGDFLPVTFASSNVYARAAGATGASAIESAV